MKERSGKKKKMHTLYKGLQFPTTFSYLCAQKKKKKRKTGKSNLEVLRDMEWAEINST